MVADRDARATGCGGGWLGRIGDWAERRRRRHAMRRLRRWAWESSQFVSRYGLANICFRTDGEIIVESPLGVRLLYLPEEKRSAMHIERGQVWEPRETDLVLRYLTDGSVFIDIGANCGWFSLVAASRFPTARVYAIEPLPRTFALLKRNIELNGLSHITAGNVGLWDQQKQLRFTNYLGPKNHVTDDPDETRVDVVPCMRLDDYVQQERIDRVDFIKCDVEGAELHVLRGAEVTLGTHKPMLLIELQGRLARRYGHTTRESIEFLTGLGYEYSLVTSQEGSKDPSDLEAGGNFLFTARKGKTGQ
ncbi:MAG: FkbM family methyltransferase [Phycisphaerae bacterium]|nr:FkbM family methyltransferase [Phycisphaerae bacterium]